MDTSIFTILDSEHRESLLLCWKIREGFRNKIAIPRIKKYVDWYWENTLKEVFELEETQIFSLLPADDKLRKKVLSQHKKLRKLFEIKHEGEFLKALTLIEEELEYHIRFTEKEVLAEFLKIADAEQIKELESKFQPQTNLVWEDAFWETNQLIPN
jgi:hypothetical protein